MRLALATLLTSLFVVTLALSSARADELTRKGALVVAAAPSRIDAKSLARALYSQAELRPHVDETMARVLVSEAPPDGDKQKKAIAETVAALDGAPISVQQRLLQSLGDQLDAELVVFVEPGPDGTRARVLRSDEGRFLSLVLASSEGAWPDAPETLRGLLRRVVKQTTQVAPVPVTVPPEPGANGSVLLPASDGDSTTDLLSSPWFWGGIGVVLAVGVTVLVLSQTTLNEPGTVVVDGRVSP